MVLTAAAFSSPFLVFGEKTDELKTEISEKNKQIQELEEEIARFQSEIEKTGKDADSLKKQISVINSTISKLSKDISVAQKKIEAAELNLQKLGIEISAQESNIDELGGGLAELVRGLYELESQSLIEVLLAKSSISDFFQDLDYMQDLSSKMKIKLAEFKEAKEQLESEKTAEESVKKELVGLGLELKERRNIEQGAKGQKDIILKETKNKETEYQRILKEREAQREAVLNEIQEIEDELRKLIDPNAIPSARQGVLSWPVKGAVLTQSFGSTPESAILYNGKPHNGIDIRAAVGTPVYAAAEGEVANTGNTDAFSRCLSYGRWVLIKHPNNLATLYAHLSLIRVSPGDKIGRGELLGYSGATGYATGPHLHFTVYDASTVRFGPSSLPRSTCKLLPFGGYLNPMAYL